MLFDTTDPTYWLVAVGLWLFGLFLTLFLAYLVIRLAITRDARVLAPPRGGPPTAGSPGLS